MLSLRVARFALVALFALSLAAISGCGNAACKTDTVFLKLTLAGSAESATRLDFELQIDGGAVRMQSATHEVGRRSDSIEIQFPSGYPSGASLRIGVRAMLGTAEIGAGETTITLAAGCTAATIDIGGDADLAGIDLSGIDLTQRVAAPGQTCDENTMCVNGSTCVDGICCTTACTGQCEACNIPGKEGTCSPTLGNPVGARTPCTGTGDPLCGGTCDGTVRDACVYPTTQCRQASCTAGVETVAASCTDGLCPAEVTNTCATTNKICGATGCSRVTSLTAGYDFTCALLEDTTARCWGENSLGQLGLGVGVTDSRDVATKVPGLNNLTRIAAGKENAGATCAVKLDGSIVCWGGNGYGVLGRGSADSMAHPDPQPVLSMAATNLTGATELGMGAFASCAIVGGTVKCWGLQYYGVAGNSLNTNSGIFYPTPVLGTITNPTELFVGGEHACAVTGSNNAGSILCWGSNGSYQLGNTGAANTTATAVAPLNSIVDASLPRAADTGIGNTACAVSNTSLLMCWGSNTYGRLGRNMTSAALARSQTPSVVCLNANCTNVGERFNTATSMCMGDFHVCGIRSTGNQIYCWGRGNHGQLGDNNIATHDRILADYVVSLPAGNPVEITCGAYHTCARSSNGKVYCWGWNDSGQLGIGSSGTDIGVPTEVSWP